MHDDVASGNRRGGDPADGGCDLVTKTAVVVVLGAAATAAAWWFLAPPVIGGSTSLAIVNGSSMFPTFERNDLVFIRPSSTTAAICRGSCR